MDEKRNFSDVMVGKAFAMLGFIRRLSFEFRDLYTLRSLWFIRSSRTPAVYGAHSMTWKNYDSYFCVLTYKWRKTFLI
jgi:hypothetical protein